MLSRGWILFTLAVILLPLAAYGDDGSVQADSSESGDTVRYFIEPIVVTTTRPVSALTYTANPRDPRQPIPANDGAAYLRSIPGFAMIRNGGTNGDPVLRGMFGSRLSVLTDGACMLGACPARMDAPTAYIAPEAFDKLTVVKGPQTVTWGPGASAGTVRFDREAPKFTSSGIRMDGAALGGSWGRNDQRAAFSAGTPRSFVRVDGGHAESGDYSDGDGEAVPSQYRKWNVDGALGWVPATGALLQVDAGTGDGEARYAGRSMDGSQFLRRSAGVRFTKTGVTGAWSKVEVQGSYHDADHVMDNYSLRDPDPMSMMPMPMAAQVERRTLNGRVTSELRLSEAFRAQLGVDGQTNAHRGRSSSGVDTYEDTSWEDDADMSDVGFFTEAAWTPADRSHVTAGVRVDRASAQDERETSGGMMPMPNPTAGVTRRETLPSGFARYVHRVGEGGSLYAGLGHSGRFPDYWELFSPEYGPMGAANAFEGVQPERTTQLDIGGQLESGRVRGWFSGYAGRIQDFILFEYMDGGMMGSTSTARNVDARTAGGEAGVAFAAAGRWSCDATVAYAWGENRTDGLPLPQIPPFETRLSIGYDDGTAWSLGGMARLVAAQERVALDQGNVVGRDLGPSSGFGVMSLNVARRIAGGVRLALGADNLFDRTYSEHLNLAGDAGFGYPADPVRVNEPGRTVWLKVDLKP
jgi:iron complex outermembrane receptor protein